ncbi:MAG: PDZ domain-containing protein [Colwellia sp.]|nr:PDZ domain-containing protein [Colwellia sp.]MCW8864351.1 PDZ domain-containing protein [Colwellia sp.]MCW9081757.1 PDZ domain-containing protein [Colwellia sp.]
MKLFSILGLLAVLSFSVIAEEKGYTGITLEVGVSGFFSPELTSAEVKKIDANSPAEKVGIKTGDKLIAIDGCKIPGCPAQEGKKLISKLKGQVLPLILQRSDGSEYSVSILVE